MKCCLLGSVRMWHDTSLHDEHKLLLPREEIRNHKLQVRTVIHDTALYLFTSSDRYGNVAVAKHRHCHTSSGKKRVNTRTGRWAIGTGSIGSRPTRWGETTRRRWTTTLRWWRRTDLPRRSKDPPFHVTPASGMLRSSLPLVANQDTSPSLPNINDIHWQSRHQAQQTQVSWVAAQWFSKHRPIHLLTNVSRVWSDVDAGIIITGCLLDRPVMLERSSTEIQIHSFTRYIFSVYQFSMY